MAGWFTHDAPDTEGPDGGDPAGAGEAGAGEVGAGEVVGGGEAGAGEVVGGGGFRLLGTRCTACGSVFFPREDSFCRNPHCAGGELAEVPLSRRGRVWSYTDGRYRPPAPYVSDPATPWEPYTLVAVELAAERMIVLGQAAPGVSVADLAVGMTVEVVPGVLDADEGADTVWTTWHFKPVLEES